MNFKTDRDQSQHEQREPPKTYANEDRIVKNVENAWKSFDQATTRQPHRLYPKTGR